MARNGVYDCEVLHMWFREGVLPSSWTVRTLHQKYNHHEAWCLTMDYRRSGLPELLEASGSIGALERWFYGVEGNLGTPSSASELERQNVIKLLRTNPNFFRSARIGNGKTLSEHHRYPTELRSENSLTALERERYNASLFYSGEGTKPLYADERYTAEPVGYDDVLDATGPLVSTINKSKENQPMPPRPTKTATQQRLEQALATAEVLAREIKFLQTLPPEPDVALDDVEPVVLLVNQLDLTTGDVIRSSVVKSAAHANRRNEVGWCSDQLQERIYEWDDLLRTLYHTDRDLEVRQLNPGVVLYTTADTTDEPVVEPVVKPKSVRTVTR